MLEDVLKKEFYEDMKNSDNFCINIWSAIANISWYDLKGDEHGFSFRQAGGVIANILGKGSYMDWYCSGPYATVTEEIAERMKKNGWSYKVMVDLKDGK